MAGRDTLVVDLGKLGHVFHLSLVAAEVTLTSADRFPRVPPSMDIVAGFPIVTEGTLTRDRSLRSVPCPRHEFGAAHNSGDVWRIKTGFAHDLDWGPDYFETE